MTKKQIVATLDARRAVERRAAFAAYASLGERRVASRREADRVTCAKWIERFEAARREAGL